MKIDKDTQVCISISERPGNFGCTIHNAAYEKLNLNFIYKAIMVQKDEIGDAIAGIRALKIRGCSVSMPHKEIAMKYLDEVVDQAKQIGSINTIVNDNGHLVGYNTDYFGAKEVIKNNYDIKGKTAVIVGAGGVSKPIIVALKKLGAEKVIILNKTDDRAKELSNKFGIEYLEWIYLNDINGNLLVNATPVGMLPNGSEVIVEKDVLKRFDAVLDVVLNPPETLLLKYAKECGIIAIPGYEMSLIQAAKQFEIYTNNPAPLDCMRQSMVGLLGL